jgi:hypothetical protein
LPESEWSFDAVPDNQILPALMWEMLRERDIEEDLKTARSWLAGELSDKRPTVQNGKRTSKRPSHSTNLSEAEIAQLRTSCIFQDFIPIGDYFFSKKMTPEKRRADYNRWHEYHIRPLLENYDSHGNLYWLLIYHKLPNEPILKISKQP